LFLEGSPSALKSPPLVAVVGTRKASRLGVEATRHLSRLILENGLGIISGLAEGIDREAHDVAAKHHAQQVAVLGTGIEVRFPASNNDLRQRIVETGGAVITEYLPDERYGKANFVQRNRIQAGLASAVCPVEANLSSGTSHTLRFAKELSRPVFGVYRTSVDRNNELFQQLVEDRTVTFNIATEDGRSDLKAFLNLIPGQRATPLEASGIDFWIKSLEDRARQIGSYHDLTDADRERIVAAVAKAIAP
jgi:DNA protecting protein DprA